MPGPRPGPDEINILIHSKFGRGAGLAGQGRIEIDSRIHRTKKIDTAGCSPGPNWNPKTRGLNPAIDWNADMFIWFTLDGLLWFNLVDLLSWLKSIWWSIHCSLNVRDLKTPEVNSSHPAPGVTRLNILIGITLNARLSCCRVCVCCDMDYYSYSSLLFERLGLAIQPLHWCWCEWIKPVTLFLLPVRWLICGLFGSPFNNATQCSMVRL